MRTVTKSNYKITQQTVKITHSEERFGMKRVGDCSIVELFR